MNQEVAEEVRLSSCRLEGTLHVLTVPSHCARVSQGILWTGTVRGAAEIYCTGTPGRQGLLFVKSLDTALDESASPKEFLKTHWTVAQLRAFLSSNWQIPCSSMTKDVCIAVIVCAWARAQLPKGSWEVRMPCVCVHLVFLPLSILQ